MSRQRHWIPQRALAPRPRRIESPWGENPVWMADRAMSMTGDLGMEDIEMGSEFLNEGGVPPYLKKWLKLRLGVTSVKKGSGSMSKYMVLGGRFDEKAQEALKLLGFTVPSAGMAYVGAETAAWHDLLKWAQMDMKKQESVTLGELLDELRGVEGEGPSRPGSTAAPS